MNKSEKQIAQTAERFALRWAGRGYEKDESQRFWTELLTDVFGISEPSTFISYEDQVLLDHTSFIDDYIERTHAMIEQKSLRTCLRSSRRVTARRSRPSSKPSMTMPPKLLMAYRENDRAVITAYGIPATLSEIKVVSRLFAQYTDLIKQQS